ncbi:hypothetical protein CY35_16G037000 [Sphagnum magellanicum]|nr:hypothetical protein CY35_16G037000 [Sphagnum magellanicum]
MIIVSRIFFFCVLYVGGIKNNQNVGLGFLGAYHVSSPWKKKVWRWCYSWQCVSYSALKENHSHFTMKANYLKVNYLPLTLFCLRVF